MPKSVYTNKPFYRCTWLMLRSVASESSLFAKHSITFNLSIWLLLNCQDFHLPNLLVFDLFELISLHPNMLHLTHYISNYKMIKLKLLPKHQSFMLLIAPTNILCIFFYILQMQSTLTAVLIGRLFFLAWSL